MPTHVDFACTQKSAGAVYTQCAEREGGGVIVHKHGHTHGAALGFVMEYTVWIRGPHFTRDYAK